MLARSGLAERRVKICEAQARLLVIGLRAIFARLGLTAEQEALAAVVVPEELRRLSTVEGTVVR
jgi:hypothetical protein